MSIIMMPVLMGPDFIQKKKLPIILFFFYLDVRVIWFRQMYHCNCYISQTGNTVCKCLIKSIYQTKMLADESDWHQKTKENKFSGLIKLVEWHISGPILFISMQFLIYLTWKRKSNKNKTS